MNKVEKNWEHFGETNPYFAVISQEKFKANNLDENLLDEFFASGEAHVERIWTEIESHFINDFKPARALDFGCGVGRLTLPIAKRAGVATGVDISQKMLEEAERNARRFDLSNLEFIKGDETLSKIKGKYDFIHSFIVFQHIKPKIGERIFERLVESLDENGIGVLHLTYADTQTSASQKKRARLYRDFPVAYKIRNTILRRADEAPFPMYLYDLNRIIAILQRNDCHRCAARFSYHGIEGVVLFFQKGKQILY